MKDLDNLICHYCGTELDVVDMIDDDTDGYIVLRCPHCHIDYRISEDEDFTGDRDVDISHRVTPDDVPMVRERCINCGSPIIISGNFMMSDLIGEDLGEDYDRMACCYSTCENCGRIEMRVMPSEKTADILRKRYKID